MRKSLIISAVAHAVALLWGLISFNATPFETSAEAMSVPVEFVTATEFSKMTAGTPNAVKADAPKPMVEKLAEKKPAPEIAQKVTEKPEIVTASTEPPPTPDSKKPDPKAKPVPQADAKPEKAEKSEQKVDPIAEALKKEEKKEKESEQKQSEAKPTPLPPKRPAPPQPKFDPSKVAALLDKRDPQRQAMTGEVMNPTASLGAPSGSSPELSQDEMNALQARLQRLWSPPVGFLQAGSMNITVRIILGRDRRLIGGPQVITTGKGPMFEAARDAAVRAIFQAQPFDMLRPETFETWRDMEVVFDPRLMFRG
jgi:outer membrane biosynthesis protein TonB